MAYAAVSESTLASPAEMESIATMRKDLEPELSALKAAGKDFRHTTGDIFFTRLLRGNNGDIAESVKWYRNFLKLREEYGLDDIHTQAEAKGSKWKHTEMPHYDEISKYMTTVFDEDKFVCPTGNLVWYDAFADARMKEMLEEVGEQKAVAAHHWVCERRTSAIDKKSYEQGKIVKIIRIIDCENGGLSQFSKEQDKFDKKWSRPVLMGTSIESVHLVFVTNFRNIWMRLWEVFKVFIPVRLVARFRLLGTDYMQDKEYLTEVGPALNKELIALNKSHVEGTTDSMELEGTMKGIRAGRVMERYVNVEAGQKVCWAYKIGKPSDSEGQGGFLSRMAGKFAGSEIVFGVRGFWYDKSENDIEQVPVKVRSAGVKDGDAAEFLVDGKPVAGFTPAAGVNVVALERKTRAVVLSKTYEFSTDADAANSQFVNDVRGLPRTCMLLVAVKGGGAEGLSEEAWRLLKTWGASISEGHWQTGYALIGLKNEMAAGENRGPDVVAEGMVPAMEQNAELVPATEVKEEDGEQKGSLIVDRAGCVSIRWSNLHSFVSNKTVAEFKVWAE